MFLGKICTSETMPQLSAEKVERCKYCGTGHTFRQYNVYSRKCSECVKQNYFKPVCKLTWRQEQDWLVGQEDNPQNQ